MEPESNDGYLSTIDSSEFATPMGNGRPPMPPMPTAHPGKDPSADLAPINPFAMSNHLTTIAATITTEMLD